MPDADTKNQETYETKNPQTGQKKSEKMISGEDLETIVNEVTKVVYEKITEQAKQGHNLSQNNTQNQPTSENYTDKKDAVGANPLDYFVQQVMDDVRERLQSLKQEVVKDPSDPAYQLSEKFFDSLKEEQGSDIQNLVFEGLSILGYDVIGKSMPKVVALIKKSYKKQPEAAAEDHSHQYEKTAEK